MEWNEINIFFSLTSHWCTPALQVLQSRVDEVKTIPLRHKTPQISKPEEEDEVVTNISEKELQEFL